jgi:hypothetical protein
MMIMNTHYSIDDQHGTNICGGLDARRAQQVAQTEANRLGAPVLLYSAEGEEQIVEPDAQASDVR